LLERSTGVFSNWAELEIREAKVQVVVRSLSEKS